MRRRPPSATLTDSLSPYPAVFRSTLGSARGFLQAPPEIKFPAQATAQRCGALRGREGAAAGLNAARPCPGYASIDRNLRQALCIGHARRRASLVHTADGLPARLPTDKRSFEELNARWINQRFPPGVLDGLRIATHSRRLWSGFPIRRQAEV